jgi:hypothetical protein
VFLILFYRLAFIRIRYNVYNNKHERVVSIRLRKSYLRSKIQHCAPEFEILDSDKRTKIGRIYPYSTDFERSEYGHAVAMRSILLFIDFIYLFNLIF